MSSLTDVPDHWLWRDGPVEPGPAVVFDMDGVLSDATRRQYLVERPRRDWDAFFEASGEDALIDDVARLLDLIGDERRIVLLTGRPVRVRPQTLDWLERHDLRWDLLIMRNWGDYEAARDFKHATVGALRKVGLDPRLAFDDDRRNVDMFHAAGVPCIYIHSGYYD